MPKQARQIVFLMVGDWFRNKEASGTATSKIAFCVDPLMAQIRIYR